MLLPADADRLQQALSALVGELMWGMRLTIGSCFLMEFGAPRLEVHEPLIPVGNGLLTRRQISQSRRRAKVAGTASLLACFDDWHLESHGLSTTAQTCRADDQIFAVASGQRLIAAQVDARCDTIALAFDLGARLLIENVTAPEPEPASEGADPDAFRLYLIQADQSRLSLAPDGRVAIEARPAG